MFRLNLRNYIKILILIFLIFLLYVCNNYENEKLISIKIYEQQIELADTYFNNATPNVYLFNLSKNLEPLEVYEEIACKKSMNYRSFRTFLCIHDTKHDVHISGSIWRDGIWELHVFRPFMDFVNIRPDSLVIDIGANIGRINFSPRDALIVFFQMKRSFYINIGQYSLFPARMGRDVG